MGVMKRLYEHLMDSGDYVPLKIDKSGRLRVDVDVIELTEEQKLIEKLKKESKYGKLLYG